ncbi:DBP protein [Fowl aviadenovirus 10]|uniref:DBP protein n=2 Tax=Fowl aviadenovirus C TaxID=190063 RepID=A0A6M6R1D3_ADEGX|nr:DNA-binding protein [Fowl aviadenovirus C]QJZ28075.1 DBP protein [Fowl aviadenovirus 10]
MGGANGFGRVRFPIGRKTDLKRSIANDPGFSSSEDDAVERPSTSHRSRSRSLEMPGEKRKHQAACLNDSDSELELMAELKPPAKPQRGKRPPPKKKTTSTAELADSDVLEAEQELKSDAEEFQPTGGPMAGALAEDPVTFSAQKAMAYLTTVCESLDMRWQGGTIEPLDAIWTKVAGLFMRRRHPEFRLTFSSFDSFYGQLGRFLAAMIYNLAGLEPKFVPGGAHVWRHGWKGATMPKCFHGIPMSLKPRTVELNPTSEAGKRAIAEQGGHVEKNRFGRQVVVLRFDNNAVCAKDKEHNGFPYPHATGSCAMVFSDAQKALSAMKHDLSWTMALYPNADRSRIEQCVLISTNCNCNYGCEAPISGRQICRMTPYKLSGTDDITKDMLESRADMKAHHKHPHTMVYTCCNPQAPGGSNPAGSSRAQRRTEKSCSWRISYMDLRYAYVFANELITTALGTEAATQVREFRWNDKYAYKTEVIAPVCPVTHSDPFA